MLFVRKLSASGVSVSVSEDGCLYGDGVIVYSLSSGKVNAPFSAINGSA